MKAHTAAIDSRLLTDFYEKRMVAVLKGVKATNEGFHCGLDFSIDPENVSKAFLESESFIYFFDTKQ